MSKYDPSTSNFSLRPLDLLSMDNQAKILEFIAYCIEMYAAKHNCSGKVIIERFDQYGVLEYLADNYEALHTQGLGYTLSLVDEYIAKQEAMA